MIKAIGLGLSLIVLAAGIAAAQPAPEHPPTPTEKAGGNESLQNGGDNRPWAAGVSQAEQQTALDMFHDANMQLNDGLFAKAADKYRAALKHWDHPAIHYNLALALMNLDQPIEAYDNLQAAVKFGEAPLQSKDKYDNAKGYLLLLDKEIAQVEVTCDKPGAKVSVDGKEVFTAPGTYKARVRAGRHTFVAELEGHPTRINAPYISPGAPFRIELKLYTVEELTRYRRRWQKAWVPYAVIGGGVAIGFIGGFLETAANNNYKSFDAQVAKCNADSGGQGCANTAALRDLRSSGDTKKELGYLGYGVGAGAVVVGALLAYLNRSTPYQITPEDLQDQQPAVSIAPVVGPGGAGAMVFGHF
jgi:tetratricopeptide (TPR) repeat protein